MDHLEKILVLILGTALGWSIRCVVIMLLWNWLMVSIFLLPEITILQALGFDFLFGFLFNNNLNIKKIKNNNEDEKIQKYINKLYKN